MTKPDPQQMRDRINELRLTLAASLNPSQSRLVDPHLRDIEIELLKLSKMAEQGGEPVTLPNT